MLAKIWAKWINAGVYTEEQIPNFLKELVMAELYPEPEEQIEKA